jgi:hypothetical protein
MDTMEAGEKAYQNAPSELKAAARFRRAGEGVRQNAVWLFALNLGLGLWWGGAALAQEKVADTKFSMDRGFYTVATNLTISSATPGATITYTLDGSDPRTSGAAISGDAPLVVLVDPDSGAGKWKATPAVTVRAYAQKAGMLPTGVDTHTYIFTDKVITQGDIRPTGDYVFWNSTEMDPKVVTNSAYSDEVDDGLLAIPTWSIVMNYEDLFGTEGIHRGDNLRSGWEKPCSLEMIYPATPQFAGFKGFQIDCGIKNQGGGGLWNQGTYDHKQSFGIRFRRDYGAGTLAYPLFEHAALNSDSATDGYDKIVLRDGHNKSWGATWDPAHTVFTRDQLSRNLQIDMTGIGGHGSFVHLYLNGIYWGLYNPSERQDNAFAATYLGGNEEDYYTGRGNLGDIAGVVTRYNQWINTASKSTNIATLLEYCNIDNHADMALISAYAAAGDFPQYYYDICNNPGGQVHFFNWDFEDAFGGGSSRSSDNPSTGNLSACDGFNNMWGNNLEYRVNFADRAYKACYNEGALTDERVLEKWNQLCDSIYTAVVCESARWGDERATVPYTRNNTWASARAAVASGTVGKAARLITALRSAGKYPSINPPLFKEGTTTIAVSRKVVPSGFSLNIEGDGATGTVYYTVDGSDPRAVGGAARGIDAGTGTTIPINSTTCVKARTLDGSSWSALHAAVFFVEQDLSALKLTEIMYNPQDTLMAAGRAITSITGNAGSIDPGFTNRALLLFSSTLPAALTGGDKVTISGASNPANNKTFTIAKVVYEGSIGQTRTTKVLLTETLADEAGAGMSGDFLYGGDRYEFVEIKNTGDVVANLSGVTFSRGVNYTFPDGATLAPGAFAVLARNAGDFASRYPGVVPFGYFPASSLDNSGERVELALATEIRYDVISTTTNEAGQGVITVSWVPAGIGAGDRVRLSLSTNYCNNRMFTIVSVAGNAVNVDQPLSVGGSGPKAFFYDVITTAEYNDSPPWPLPADGYGFSLTPTTPNPSGSQDLVSAWRASANANGSPGVDDPAAGVTTIKVNEALTHTDAPQRETIELYNPNGVPVDLAGWHLTDDLAYPQKWTIPTGKVIPANGYLTFYGGHFEGTNLLFDYDEFGSAFLLRSTGDEVYLFSPDLGFSHGFSYEGALNGVSFGRYVTSQGEEHFPSQTAFTPDAVNSGPVVGPVVITEIMYNPADGGHEFIELANISGSPVALYDPAFPTNTWKVGGIGFQFPASNVTLGGGEVLLLVRDTITPAAFRTANNVPGYVQIFSYDGSLDNGGEEITLRRPDEPVQTGLNAGEVPYIVVDRVKYEDQSPWPAEPDGTGASLERIVSQAYGNDVANWQASSFAGGTPGLGGTAPTTPLFAVSPNSINISVEVGQDAPAETIEVWNSGTNTLDYVVEESSPMFSVWPGNGTSTNASQKVIHTVTFATAALSVGLHQATITVADNGSGAPNGPISINVAILVNPPPAPQITMDTAILQPVVTEGSNATTNTFKVWNSGTGTLNYSVSDDAAWLNVTPAGGSSVGAGSKQTHTVSYATAGLPAGNYTGVITVTDTNATNSAQTINVQLTVREPLVFTAYNDFSWAVDQITYNISRYTTEAGDGTPPAGTNGLLMDYASGLPANVTLGVSGGQWDGATHTTQGANAAPGTDADSVFGNGKVSCKGLISYGSAGNVLLAFSGLDKDTKYTLVLFANRDGYEDRNSKFTLSDVASFTNESTAGAVRSTIAMPDDSVTIIANNTARGYVARFAEIDPGPDGDMLVTVAGSHTYLNAMMLSARASQIPDGDHDLMADSWEMTYFGSTNSPDGAADLDYDGDGMTTLEEYLTGSNPTNAASCLRIEGIVPASATDLSVTWQSFYGKVYTVVSTTNFSDWSAFRTGLVATPPQNSMTVPVTNLHHFFRVQQE